jgi:uncharacterized membrane protein YdjX (TVP38/TMEM64 family)
LIRVVFKTASNEVIHACRSIVLQTQQIMPATANTKKIKICFFFAVMLLCLLVLWFRAPLWDKMLDYYRLFSDRGQIRQFVSSFGSSAPPIFMLIQILQVMLAPVPGEATGFIGGYLFGVLPGFIYSSIGLTVGSWLNFVIGRLLGKRYVRKLIPADRFEKIDAAVKRQGVIVLFILFLFPGFPKDYLCLALGLSTLPVKIFILLAGLGRMPGTFALSLQGAFLYEKNYMLLGFLIGACLILALLCYAYRERIYLWVEKLESK